MDTQAASDDGDSPEAARLSRIVWLVAWAAALGGVLPLAYSALNGRWRTAAVLLAAEAGAVVVLGCLRRNRLSAAIGLLVTAVQLCAFALVVVGGRGFHDVAMMLFPAGLVVAGLFLRRRVFAAISLGTTALVMGIGLAETSGIFVAPRSSTTDGGSLLYAGSILCVTALTVGLLADSVRTSLARARAYARAAEAANAGLLEQARQLQVSEERFRSLIDLAVDGILIGDAQRRIVGANRRMQELTGHAAADLLGRPVAELFSPEEIRRTPLRFGSIEAGDSVVSERLLLRRDGTSVPVEMSSKKMPDGTYQSFFRDITERRRAQEEQARLLDELRQAQKMEAVGRLAGGIAHDFNNMLMVVRSTVTVALRSAAPGSVVHRCLTEAEQASERASALTSQLLAFGRKKAILARLLDLGELVGNLRPMLAGVAGRDVSLEIDAPRGLGLVMVDAGQLEQALVNLAMNARDAMPRGGRLEFALSEACLGGERAAALGLPPGTYVTLAVTDTGTGMSEDVRRHLFEPFFTTKPAGQGTGLGLAMVYGAVKQNRGAIEVDSALGQGTTFRLVFPCSAAGRAEHAAHADPEATAEPAPALATSGA